MFKGVFRGSRVILWGFKGKGRPAQEVVLEVGGWTKSETQTPAKELKRKKKTGDTWWTAVLIEGCEGAV